MQILVCSLQDKFNEHRRISKEHRTRPKQDPSLSLFIINRMVYNTKMSCEAKEEMDTATYELCPATAGREKMLSTGSL